MATSATPKPATWIARGIPFFPNPEQDRQGTGDYSRHRRVDSHLSDRQCAVESHQSQTTAETGSGAPKQCRMRRDGLTCH